MRTLLEYLTWVKKEVPQLVANASSSRPLRVVMGNEAGDMDSFACALVYAWFLAEATSPMEAVVPVLNVPRAELQLRRDSVAVFKTANIYESDLIFADEFDLKAVAKQGMRLTLVDHNELSPRQDWLAASVVEILDHHQDALLYKSTVESRDVVFPCGSATTLVTRAMRATARGQEQLADRSVSLLLQTVLMLDTANLESEAKTTPLDREQLLYNRQIVPAALAFGEEYSDAAWYAHAKKCREDISGFSPVDVMKKDLKFGLVGQELFAIASAGASLHKLGVDNPQKREGFLHELLTFTRSYELTASFVLLTAATEGGQKQVLMCTSDDEWKLYASTFIDTMESGKEYGKIALQGGKAAWESDGSHEVKHGGHVFALYEFTNAASRKQMLPAVDDFFAAHPRVRDGGSGGRVSSCEAGGSSPLASRGPALAPLPVATGMYGSGKSRKIECKVEVFSLNSLNQVDNAYSASVYVQLRLPKDNMTKDGMEKINCEFTNLKSSSRDTRSSDDEGDYVCQHIVVTGDWCSPMNLDDFPMDTQNLWIKFELWDAEDMSSALEPVPYGMSLAKGFMLNEEFMLAPKVDEIVEVLADIPTFHMKMTMNRHVGFYMFSYVMPITSMSSLAFCVLGVGRDNVGDRLNTILMLLLTVVAYKMALSGDLPVIPSPCKLDQYMSGALLFLALITFLCSLSQFGKTVDVMITFLAIPWAVFNLYVFFEVWKYCRAKKTKGWKEDVYVLLD